MALLLPVEKIYDRVFRATIAYMNGAKTTVTVAFVPNHRTSFFFVHHTAKVADFSAIARPLGLEPVNLCATCNEYLLPVSHEWQPARQGQRDRSAHALFHLARILARLLPAGSVYNGDDLDFFAAAVRQANAQIFS